MSRFSSFARGWLAAFAGALAFAAPATADDFYVDRFEDALDNGCTQAIFDCALRGAIIAANANPGADTIYLETGTYELSRISGTTDAERDDLDITDTLTIVGLGPERTTIDANGIYRVIDVNAPSGFVVLAGVRITGGHLEDMGSPISFGGAGIRVSAGHLTLDTCEVSDNAADGGYGGGILDNGGNELVVRRSWIHDNSSIEGGGIRAGELEMEASTVSGNLASSAGGVHAAGATVITDSSIVGNSASSCSTGFGACGGLLVPEGSIATLTGCTLSSNDGAQLYAIGPGLPSLPSLRLKNTVVVGGGSFLTTGCTTYSSGEIESLGGNLESPGDTCSLTGFDLYDVADAGIDTVASWSGGPTPTYRPLPGSPAIDFAFADVHGTASDQRLAGRPAEGDGAPPARCDVGAVELQGPGDLFVEGFESGFLTAWSGVAP